MPFYLKIRCLGFGVIQVDGDQSFDTLVFPKITNNPCTAPVFSLPYFSYIKQNALSLPLPKLDHLLAYL